MKKYNNFCITWVEDGAKHEKIIFDRRVAIREYIDLSLARWETGRNISGLTIYGVKSVGYVLEDITAFINSFLAD